MNNIWTSVVEGMGRRRAAAMIIAMTVMLAWTYFIDFSPSIKTEKASATVMEVKKAGWHLELDTGETVWIYASPDVTVKQGDTVPILINTFKSGERRIEFDKEKWIFGG